MKPEADMAILLVQHGGNIPPEDGNISAASLSLNDSLTGESAS